MKEKLSDLVENRLHVVDKVFTQTIRLQICSYQTFWLHNAVLGVMVIIMIPEMMMYYSCILGHLKNCWGIAVRLTCKQNIFSQIGILWIQNHSSYTI